MTEFHVEVVRIGKVEKHPNADTLSMTTVHEGYPVLFKTGEYVEGDLAVYIPVDSIVPDTAEWAWLGDQPKHRRIRAKKLRGIFSMGLLTKAPEGVKVGQDVAALLNITKHDPDAHIEAEIAHPWKTFRQSMPWWKVLLWSIVLRIGLAPLFGRKDWTRVTAPPKLKYLPGVYDIEPFRKYGRSWFTDGELVVVTEKIHGQNASFVHDGKKLHIKSRTRWRRNDPTESGNTWAQVAKKYDLERKLKAHPGILLFGETYGNNADMPYGVNRQKDGDEFVAFDAFDTNIGQWLNADDFERFCQRLDVPTAPTMATVAWSDRQYDSLLSLAEGHSWLATKNGAHHIREGFVIKPLRERRINGGQRVILKMAGEAYLTRKAA